MALEDDIRILSGVRLFDSLTHEQLRLLAFGAENIRLNKGRDLFREDAAADCAYVVSKGRIALYRTVDGERVAAGFAEPGEVLDEMALIVHLRRRSGAYADEDSEVIRLNRSLFRRILEEYPEVAAALRDRFAAEFTEMVDRIATLSTRFER
ncbi:MAG: Crp/Fnr family transcriptional regulator [Mesorhizobium sp.]|nr:Crp/Fnr family transcriptional regulator [Mesorhizobium sp.]MCO5161674.1 Crp/Fnr family transcriptional regulator [Mesorhizobium sp.]